MTFVAVFAICSTGKKDYRLPWLFLYLNVLHLNKCEPIGCKKNKKIKHFSPLDIPTLNLAQNFLNSLETIKFTCNTRQLNLAGNPK